MKMKKMFLTFLIAAIFVSMVVAFPITLKDVCTSWLQPSGINTWTSSWMLPLMYESATNTKIANAYYRHESLPSNLDVVGAYGFYKFVGVDYMHATLKTSYTTFHVNRYTLGLAIPNAGFDLRYTSVKDKTLSYYNEVNMDIEFLWKWGFNPFLPLGFTAANSKNVITYVKLFNFVRYIKPSYPSSSKWQSVFSLDYFTRSIWFLQGFALVYDNYNGTDEINTSTASYQALELLVKPWKSVILRGGVTFENQAEKAQPMINVGIKVNFGQFNMNAGYELVLLEPENTFALSCGTTF